MKFFTLLAALLLIGTGCSSPQEKYDEERAEAKEDYEEQMQEADEEYREDKKDEAKDLIDEGSDVNVGKKKRSIEVQD